MREFEFELPIFLALIRPYQLALLLEHGKVHLQ